MARNIPLGNGPTFFGSLGQGVAQGLDNALPNVLSYLAQNKAYNIAAQHYKTLNPNLSDAEAQAIVRQSPEIQQAALSWTGNRPQTQVQQLQNQPIPQQTQQATPQTQVPQVAPQQLQLMEPHGLQALQLAQGLKAVQGSLPPSFAEQEFLRRLPEPAKKKLGGGLMEQPQENGLLFNKPQAQIPNVNPIQQIAAPNIQPALPLESQPTLGQHVSERLQKGPKTKEQVSKEDQQFGLELQKKIDSGVDLERDLDRIDKLIDKSDIQWGYFAGKVPRAFLNENTKKLQNLFSDILVKQTKAAGQGRGSDLLRRMVQEGKFDLAQGPEVWHDISERLREEVDYDKKLYKARHEILKEYGGKPPTDIGYLVRERVAQDIRNEPKPAPFSAGSTLDALPKPGSPEARKLEGRALEGPNGPIIYFGGKPYPAVKKNGKWVRK